MHDEIVWSVLSKSSHILNLTFYLQLDVVLHNHTYCYFSSPTLQVVSADKTHSKCVHVLDLVGCDSMTRILIINCPNRSLEPISSTILREVKVYCFKE